MGNWYSKACTNSRFWDIWERHDAYSAAGLPIYFSKTEYGRAAAVLDLTLGTVYADIYLDPSSVPIGYDDAELRFGNTFETSAPVESNSRTHSTSFEVDPGVISKIASLDADKSLWWFMYLRLSRTDDGTPVIAGSDDLVGTSRFGDEILTSIASDLKKWCAAAEWERVDRYLATAKSDFMRMLTRASTDSVKKLGSALVEVSATAPVHLEKGDAYLVENWDDMMRRNARAVAAVAAREA